MSIHPVSSDIMQNMQPSHLAQWVAKANAIIDAFNKTGVVPYKYSKSQKSRPIFLLYPHQLFTVFPLVDHHCLPIHVYV